MEKIVYEYPKRDNVVTEGLFKALDYVYSISYPTPDKNFVEMCEDLKKEREEVHGDGNWRKTYCNGKYQWPTDFFYIPKDVLQNVWDTYKEAYGCLPYWDDNIKFLLEILFEEPGIKEVYTPTEWSEGKNVKHCEKQVLLKDRIGEENASIVKEIIEGYKYTYKFDRKNTNDFNWGFMSTPSSNRESVQKAWKEAFNKEIVIPEDTAWIDEYQAEED